MYIWRLLLLLILSLLDPILSERREREIDGRHSCTYFSRSTCADEFVSRDEKYRSGKSTPQNRRLGELREIPFHKHRYEARDAEVVDTLLSDERRARPLILALDEQNRGTVERQHDKTDRDTNRSVFRSHRTITLLKNNRKSYESLQFRLFHEESERQDRTRLGPKAANSFERNISKRDLTRDFEKVLGRIRTPIDRLERINIRNNERNIRMNIVRGNYTYIRDLQRRLTNNERHLSGNIEAFTKGDNYQTPITQIKDQHIIYKHNRNRLDVSKEANRMMKKNINYEDDRAVRTTTERLSRENVRERTPIPTEHGVRQPHARRDKDGVKRYINVKYELTNITNNASFARHDNLERVITMREQDGSRVTFSLPRNLRQRITNERTGITNDKRYTKDSTGKSRKIATEIRDMERNLRTAEDQLDTGRIIDEKIVRNRWNLNTWIKDSESDNVNFKRNVRTQSLERAVRLNVGRVTERQIDRKRAMRNLSVNQPVSLENEKEHVKDNTRKSALLQYNVIQQATERMSNIPIDGGRKFGANEQRTRAENNRDSRQNSHQTVTIEREKRKSNERITRTHIAYTERHESRKTIAPSESYGISDRYIIHNEVKHNSNVRQQGIQIVRATLSTERGEYQSNPQRVIQEHGARIREERQYNNVRNVASYTRDISRESIVFSYRNERQQVTNRLMSRYIDSSLQNRIAIARDERSKTTKNIRNLKSNKSERAVSTELIDPNREAQYAHYLRIERTRIRNMESFSTDTSRVKGVLNEIEVRKSDQRNMGNERIGSKREEQSVGYERKNINAAERYSRTNMRERLIDAEQSAHQLSERRCMNKYTAHSGGQINMLARIEHVDDRISETHAPYQTRAKTVYIEGVHNPGLRNTVEVHCGRIREERNSNIKSTRNLIKNHEHETFKLDNRRVSNEYVVDRHNKQNANVRGLLIDKTKVKTFSRDTMRNIVISVERNTRQFEERKMNLKRIVRSPEEQDTRTRDEQRHTRKSEYYVRHNRARRTVSVEREVRLQHLKRIIVNYSARSQTDLRLTERQVRGVTEEQRETYSVRSRTDSRTLNSRRTIPARIFRTRDAQSYRTRETLQFRESENILMLPSDSEFYQHRQSNDLAYINTIRRANVLERDHSRRSAAFPSALSAMVRKKVFVSQNAMSKNKSDVPLYWQYFFYALQGIYVFVVFMRVIGQEKNDKTSSRSWLAPTRFIKVD